MIGEICKYLNNYFVKDRADIVFANFEVVDGSFTVESRLDDYLQEGQFFRIVGSVFNDGVYQYPANDLHDEMFCGALWPMNVPPEVVTLASEITAWLADDVVQKVSDSPYASESWGGYSYSKETGSDGTFSWQSHFAARLNPWRKAKVNS